jgi:hypothetical protein
MTKTENFEDLISPIHPDRTGSIVALLEFVGCARFKVDNGQFYLQYPPTSGIKHEPLVQEIMLLALQWHADCPSRHHFEGLSLFYGLTENGRWRTCLDTSDVNDVYALAANAAAFLSLFPYIIQNENPLARLTVTVTGGVLSLLNEWLQPETPFDTLECLPEVLVCFFGTAWYNIIGCQAEDSASEIAHLILSTKPPFRPGLTHHNTSVEATTLPSLETP